MNDLEFKLELGRKGILNMECAICTRRYVVKVEKNSPKEVWEYAEKNLKESVNNCKHITN